MPTYELYIGFGSWEFDPNISRWNKRNHQFNGCGAACKYHYQYFSVVGQPADTTWTVTINGAGKMTLRDQGGEVKKEGRLRENNPGTMDPVKDETVTAN